MPIAANMEVPCLSYEQQLADVKSDCMLIGLVY